MRRPLVCQRDRACAVTLALCLALGQHLGDAGQPVNFAGMARHHIRQILHRTGQMRDAFF